MENATARGSNTWYKHVALNTPKPVKSLAPEFEKINVAFDDSTMEA
jgi:hypothetical protein